MEFTNEPVVFCADKSFFVNTKALIIYYYDVLNIPWLTYLSVMRGNPEMQKPRDMNFSLLANMSTSELMNWYMLTRKHFNPLKDLWMRERTPEIDDTLDSFLFTELAKPESQFIHQIDYPFLTIPDFLSQVIENKFCDYIYVYTEVENPNIEKVIHAKYGKDIRILYGDLYDHMAVLPAEATYIFSRFELFETLIDTNRLNYSTVLLPYDFRYNMNEDKTGFIYDIEILQKTYTFKFALYNTFRG